MGAIIFFVSTFFSQHRTSFSEDRFEAIEEMRTVTEAIERVRHEFVDPVADDVLIAGAIRGILSELDEYSHYLTVEEYAEIQRNSAGSYTGVGLNVSLEGGQVTVVAPPLEGTPAQRAGILPLDVVLSVDGMAVDGENLEETVERLRGVFVQRLEGRSHGLGDRALFRRQRFEKRHEGRTVDIEGSQ